MPRSDESRRTPRGRHQPPCRQLRTTLVRSPPDRSEWHPRVREERIRARVRRPSVERSPPTRPNPRDRRARPRAGVAPLRSEASQPRRPRGRARERPRSSAGSRCQDTTSPSGARGAGEPTPGIRPRPSSSGPLGSDAANPGPRPTRPAWPGRATGSRFDEPSQSLERVGAVQRLCRSAAAQCAPGEREARAHELSAVRTRCFSGGVRSRSATPTKRVGPSPRLTSLAHSLHRMPRVPRHVLTAIDPATPFPTPSGFVCSSHCDASAGFRHPLSASDSRHDPTGSSRPSYQGLSHRGRRARGARLPHDTPPPSPSRSARPGSSGRGRTGRRSGTRPPRRGRGGRSRTGGAPRLA